MERVKGADEWLCFGMTENDKNWVTLPSNSVSRVDQRY